MSGEPPVVIIQNRGCGSGCATLIVALLVLGSVSIVVRWVGENAALVTLAVAVVGIAGGLTYWARSRRAQPAAEDTRHTCPECGEEWRGRAVRCPRCGHHLF